MYPRPTITNGKLDFVMTDSVKTIYEEYDINDLIKSTRHQDDKIAIETMREEFGFSEDLIQDLFDFHRDRISE